MLIESIGYTAMLVDYIAKLTHRDLANIASAIGEAGIARLVHNAPMNRHLPILRIANEVMHDYGITCRYADLTAEVDKSFSASAIESVQSVATHKGQYASVLYSLLRGTSN